LNPSDVQPYLQCQANSGKKNQRARDELVYRAKNYKQWGRYGVMTKQQKAAAKKFAVALHRLDLGA
jgi:hypothetical protein